MKALPKRKGNLVLIGVSFHVINCLNESPYDKEGKSVAALQFFKGEAASMKAPPKRKGNAVCSAWHSGKPKASMKALPKRKGNGGGLNPQRIRIFASMKALPKRKGNYPSCPTSCSRCSRLNESPSKKEGKFNRSALNDQVVLTSMKALPKRKGNVFVTVDIERLAIASMKVPTRRQRNSCGTPPVRTRHGLNESPPKKEGKYVWRWTARQCSIASMKVYISSCRTRSLSVILGHHNSLSY